MEGRSWFKIFPAEYLAGDLALLDNEEFGAMIRLLFHNWIAISLPSELKQLARLTGCSAKEMERLWPILSSHFPEIEGSPGRLGNPGLAEYELHRSTVAASKSRAGRTPRKSYDDHPLKRGEKNRPEEIKTPPYAPPEGADAGGAGEAPKQPSVRRKTKGEPTLAPNGFMPSASSQAWFRGRYGEVRKSLVLHQTDQFLAHHARDGKVFVDWDAAWRTWMNNWQTDFGRNVPTNGDDPASKRPPGVPENDPNLVKDDDLGDPPGGDPSSDLVP